MLVDMPLAASLCGPLPVYVPLRCVAVTFVSLFPVTSAFSISLP